MSDATISIRLTDGGALAWATAYPAGANQETIESLTRQAVRGAEIVQAALAAPPSDTPAPGERITGPQIELIYRLARKAAGSDQAVRDTVRRAYQRAISDLDKTQASAVIAWLKGEGPAPASAERETRNAESPTVAPAPASPAPARPSAPPLDDDLFPDEPPAIPVAPPETTREGVEDARRAAAGLPTSAPPAPPKQLTLAEQRAHIADGFTLLGWPVARQNNWLVTVFKKRDVDQLTPAEVTRALHVLRDEYAKVQNQAARREKAGAAR